MSDEDDSDEEMYSITSSQTVYKRSRSRSYTGIPMSSSIASREKSYRTFQSFSKQSDSDERRPSATYLPVQKWAVDYNNRNYVRSLCNKNRGLHRRINGRPFNWRVQYDNNYYDRSKFNEPKGMHRRVPEVKRKYAPDDDDLADATGWQFDCGPEYDQIEQDVPYIPEGRIITRGGYRWYGVKRNDSDCDIKQEEVRDNFMTEELEEQLKCGQEFPQSDVPYLTEPKDRQYVRGGYRHYEVPRNAYDILPEELDSADDDPEWKRKHHTSGFRYLDLDMCNYDRDYLSDYRRKGKPFRRTILNKVYELRKTDDSRKSSRHGTRVSLVPGEGDKTVYEGVSDRLRRQIDKSPSIRSVFKKKMESKRYKSSGSGQYEEYEIRNTEKYRELRPEYEERMRRMAGSKRDRRKLSERDSGRFDEYAYGVEPKHEIGRKRKISPKTSPSDVREEFETWRENAQNAANERAENANYYRSKESQIYRGREGDSSRNIHEDNVRGIRSPKRYPSDVREEFETWKENAQNAANERAENANYYRSKEREIYKNREGDSSRNIHEDNLRGMRSPKRYPSDVREEFETWKENTENRKTENAKYYRSKEKEDVKVNVGDSQRKTVMEKRKHPAKKHQYDRNGTHARKISPRTQKHDRGAHESPESYRDHYRRKNENILRDEELSPGRDKVLKKLPPHVEERMKQIRHRMESNVELVKQKHQDETDSQAFTYSESDPIIDLMKHKGHPHDTGETHDSEYEKYITKNGSEVWVKKEEKFAELHHKNER